MGNQSFLELYTPNEDRLRREIQNIADSYNNQWDIIAELAQNSVDAVRRWNKLYGPKKHTIEIVIDQKNKGITIVDSGCGINPNKLPQLFIPGETDKVNDKDSIGEKGVGLKFVIFSCNSFAIETSANEGSYQCNINDSYKWLTGTQNAKVPIIENEKKTIKTQDKNNTHTKITIADVYNNDHLFSLSLERLEYLLRTKTAIGYTSKKFGKGNLDVSVKLKLIDGDGAIKEKEIPFEYVFPETLFDKKDSINIDDFIKKAVSYDDRQKKSILAGKCLLSENNTVVIDNRTFSYYAFFVPSRETWITASQKNNLGEGKDDDFISDIKSGIFVSTKGMPTGIELTPPSTGAMGYWSNLFILIEYDAFAFDVGRKTVPGRMQPRLKDLAKEQFNKFSYWKQLVASEKAPPPKILADYKKTAQIDTFQKLPDLGLTKINFLKQPNNQEAGVVAIFHELIGSGQIQGYYGLTEGYKQNYDFWGLYKINKSNLGQNIKNSSEVPDIVEKGIVIEFKLNASSIIDDLKDDIKALNDIDLLVCWDVDEAAFSKEHIIIEPIKKDDVIYYGSNKKAIFPVNFGAGVGELQILSLKDFINEQLR
ncbi:MAG: ATP-binding protein [Candidatus Marsarchaeota archaeon]|jgi:molecular chaperone HtpG|nr:ATP-binding protein [Candidatus Marsarchaeota archaeon]